MATALTKTTPGATVHGAWSYGTPSQIGSSGNDGGTAVAMFEWDTMSRLTYMTNPQVSNLDSDKQIISGRSSHYNRINHIKFAAAGGTPLTVNQPLAQLDPVDRGDPDAITEIATAGPSRFDVWASYLDAADMSASGWVETRATAVPDNDGMERIAQGRGQVGTDGTQGYGMRCSSLLTYYDLSLIHI